jgi:serine/threonine protein kinase
MGCCSKKKTQQLLIDKNYTQNNEDKSELSTIKLSYLDFDPLYLIGTGSLGKVILVRYKKNKNIYAMKELSKSKIKINKQEEHSKSERDLMIELTSPFIVNIKFAFQDETKLYIVSEFLQGGDMFYHMHHSTINFTENTVKFYIIELILAIEFLHENNVIYRDLKPENILMNSEGHIKISDFGLSKKLENQKDKAYTLCGTLQYLAPEILKNKGYDKSVDWWSLGCIYYEMLTGNLPFKTNGNKINLDVFEEKIDFDENMNPLLINLISQLLNVNPKKRLGYGAQDAKKIKEHQYFNDVDWNKYLNKEIEPPFVPKLEGELDLRYFDKCFTDEPVNSNRTTINSRSNATSEYNGFTYMTQSIAKEITDCAKNDEEKEHEQEL